MTRKLTEKAETQLTGKLTGKPEIEVTGVTGEMTGKPETEVTGMTGGLKLEFSWTG